MSSQSRLTPSDWQARREQGARMLEAAFDRLEHVRERPLWRPIPDEARSAMREPLPVGPTDLDQVHEIFQRLVAPHGSGNDHPGFMGWVQGGGTDVGMLAEMLAGGLNANLGGRDHMPIEVERQVLRWVRELFGFPDEAEGLFVTGASMANFMALLVARTRALGPEVRDQGLGAAGQALTAYTSTSAHACIRRAMEMSGLGARALRVVGVDERRRIDLGALRQAIAQDRAAGLEPFMVIGTAGTVDVGAIDDLDAMADLAAAEGLWLHVDGAFGAMGMLSPAIRPRLAGLERADSVAFDFHKWGQAPYDAGFLLVRDGALHKATFAADAAYLRRERRGLAGGDWWPCDYGPDLSRGFRALKVWFTFKVFGAAALGEVVDKTCALAQALEGLIVNEPELELLAPASLNIVCFRFRCEDPDGVNTEIVARLHEAGRVAPSTTRIDGRLAIRAAIFNHRTETDDIDALVRSALAFGRAIVQEHRA